MWRTVHPLLSLMGDPEVPSVRLTMDSALDRQSLAMSKYQVSGHYLCYCQSCYNPSPDKLLCFYYVIIMIVPAPSDTRLRECLITFLISMLQHMLDGGGGGHNRCIISSNTCNDVYYDVEYVEVERNDCQNVRMSALLLSFVICNITVHFLLIHSLSCHQNCFLFADTGGDLIMKLRKHFSSR